MFFKKKPNQNEKKQGHLDKVVTGVILGAAIGSVLGVGFAPKKGQETRKEIGKKAGGFFKKIKNGFQEGLFPSKSKNSLHHKGAVSVGKLKANLKDAKKIPEES